ncbi:DUF4142 domain-containing protein [Gluconacetobacter asukensis]|uniref:DUF4142 domain-containing protein n=2 Tax=Gluconacetobacter asukensis TaxID=1017181 RepID=A0A7W4IZ81_9PROT|nr:DUF4142 domain-containing protein [Gluconacetobacter asukensis]
MTYRAVLTAAGAAVLVVLSGGGPLHAQSVGERSGVNSLLGVSPSTADFVRMVALSDMFEIQSAKLALARSKDDSVRAFAQRMLKDHQATTMQLKEAIGGRAGIEAPPTALDQAHETKLNQLRNLKGPGFDRQYRTEQITAHEDAVSLFTRYSEGKEDQALRDFATHALPTLTEHLRMARALPITHD